MRDEDYIETTVQSLRSGELDDLQLKLVTGDDGMGRVIARPRVQKPGLAFAGYYEYIKPWRVQIIGASETGAASSSPPSSAPRRATRRGS